jgi:hypothetical protein
MAITGEDDFKAKVRSSMRQVQNKPEKVSSFHPKPSLPRECLDNHELIDHRRWQACGPAQCHLAFCRAKKLAPKTKL